jgi:hypothetical protein
VRRYLVTCACETFSVRLLHTHRLTRRCETINIIVPQTQLISSHKRNSYRLTSESLIVSPMKVQHRLTDATHIVSQTHVNRLTNASSNRLTNVSSDCLTKASSDRLTHASSSSHKRIVSHALVRQRHRLTHASASDGIVSHTQVRRTASSHTRKCVNGIVSHTQVRQRHRLTHARASNGIVSHTLIRPTASSHTR